MVCCSNQSEILAYHYTPKLVFKPEADPLNRDRAATIDITYQLFN